MMDAPKDSPRKKEGKKGKKKGDKTPRPGPSTPSLLDLPNQETGPANKVTVDVKDCPCTGVTVYNDRAEVTRGITATVKAGSNELSVFGLSSKVDRNSVRVAGGKGSAIILEVSYNQRWEDKKNDESEVGRLKREGEELDAKIAAMREALSRIDKENQWLEKWANTLANPPQPTKGETSVEGLFSPKMVDQAMNFMEVYQKKLADIDGRRAAINKDLKETNEQRTRLINTLNGLTSGDREQVHEVIVLLIAEADNQVELSLSYVVMGASWHAAYDVRVQSASNDLSLTYYGIIVNDSLDDWKDASLSLSTAQPSVGGAPPQLTTKFIGFRQPEPTYWPSSRSMSHAAPYLNVAVQQAISSPEAHSPWSRMEDADYGNVARDEEEEERLRVMTSAVKESSICTSFTIPRSTTILSDNKPHKVTIRIIDLVAKFTYVIIPKLSLHAYLKASITNTSENYPFLPGEINVFMDGNFVAKSTIKAVSPQESFALFLGTDDAIKVTYPPGVFFKDTQGILSKRNLKTLKHLITIKNTKSKEVTVVVFDQLPKPNDAQIKVKLLKPTIQEGQTDVVLTEANNLKWKRDIPAGKEIKLPFEYSIEWPVGQELTGH